jgi:hypothetical protein
MTSKYEKYIKSLASILLLLTLFRYSFAATLQLTKIGALDLGGKTYQEWWYTGTNPTFYGKAAVSSKVDLKIGETTFSTTSNTTGDWSYAATLAAGEHKIVITQGAESLSLTLHLGENVPANVGATTTESTQAATTVPTTGFNQYVALSFSFGVILLATYFYFSSDSKRKSVFETRMLKED